MTLRSVAIALVLAAPAHAADWTADDTTRQAAFLALGVVDWMQTRYIAKHPESFHETNPFVFLQIKPGEPSQPSLAKVNRYFVLYLATHTVISYALPSTWRAGFQYISIGIEANTVARNWRLGIGLNF